MITQDVVYFTNEGRKLLASKVEGYIVDTYGRNKKGKLVVVKSERVVANADKKTDCHGTTILCGANWLSSYVSYDDGSKYLNTAKVLEDDGWQFQTSDIDKAQASDLIIFRNEKGEILHSAIYNGDGTFQTKNGDKAYQENATYESLMKTYSKSVEFYRGGGDKVVEDIDSKVIGTSSEGAEILEKDGNF